MTARRPRKLKLLRLHPYCHWCGRRVYDYPHTDHESQPDDAATIDHLNSRNQSSPRPRQGEWVLSCRRCNMERAEAEVRARPIEELWRASGRYPSA